MDKRTEGLAELLLSGESVIKDTHGKSMQPLLSEGKTKVFIQPLNKPLKIGDLPLRLCQNGKYVLHRLVDEDDTYYYTRGDNCTKKERFLKKRIIGVATDICRDGKWFPVTDRRYRAYVWVWMHSFLLRAVWYRLRDTARRLYMAATGAKGAGK